MPEQQSPRTATLSKGLLYRQYADCGAKAEAEKLRRDLRSIAVDRKFLGYAREQAIDALFADGWSRREEWFLSLFRDPSLRYLRDGGIRRPLLYHVGDDPEHWIPIVTHLVGNPNRAIHDNAVECLIQFQLRNTRRDALTPLLPWLFDPKWSSASDRLRLIQSVDDLDMKDSVPGLIAVLNQKVDEAERAYAANSLIHFRDARVVPDLRRGMP